MAQAALGAPEVVALLQKATAREVDTAPGCTLLLRQVGLGARWLGRGAVCGQGLAAIVGAWENQACGLWPYRLLPGIDLRILHLACSRGASYTCQAARGQWCCAIQRSWAEASRPELRLLGDPPACCTDASNVPRHLVHAHLYVLAMKLPWPRGYKGSKRGSTMKSTIAHAHTQPEPHCLGPLMLSKQLSPAWLPPPWPPWPPWPESSSP